MSIKSIPQKEKSSELYNNQFRDNFDDDNDETNPTNMIKYVLNRMIQRIDSGLDNKGSNLDEYISDLRMFVYLQHTQIIQNSGLVLILQDVFTRYITIHGISFIKEYKTICDDDKFNDYIISIGRLHEEIPVQPVLPPMAAEDLLNIDKLVEDNCKWNILKKVNAEKGSKIKKENRPPIKYEVGQIVGAKDSERKWWMSRVLYVFIDPNYPYPWYYVHFEGWKDIHNEWISSPYRIKPFNPRRDFLKR
jgi:hypothetical protein